MIFGDFKMEENADTHRQLLQLFYDYVRINLRWEEKQSHLSGMEVRQILSEIRRLARVRRAEIQDVRAAKPKNRSPVYPGSRPKASDDTET